MPFPPGGGRGSTIPSSASGSCAGRRSPPRNTRAGQADSTRAKFDAEAVAQLAQDAGMKYVVITAKHHDGFAMYDSKVTPYDIVDATPYKRDPLKALAGACAGGAEIRLLLLAGPGLARAQRRRQHLGLSHAARAAQARRIPRPQGHAAGERAADQLRPPRPHLVRHAHVAQQAAACRRWRRWCGSSSRAASSTAGSATAWATTGRWATTWSPRTCYPSDWEVPATLNDTWGFKSRDRNWKSTGYLIYRLVDVVSKGGNYLLNVGPDGRRRHPRAQRADACARSAAGSPATERRSTAAAPAPSASGSEAFRATAKPGVLYVHLLRWPAGGRFGLAGLENTVKRAFLLSDPERGPLQVGARGETLVVGLPFDAPDPHISVLALTSTTRPGGRPPCAGTPPDPWSPCPPATPARTGPTCAFANGRAR